MFHCNHETPLLHTDLITKHTKSDLKNVNNIEENNYICSDNLNEASYSESSNDIGDDKKDDNNNDSFNLNNNFSLTSFSTFSTEIKCYSLFCVAINVGGITTKLLHPEFENFIKLHDIICISESKLSDTETVHIEGFTSFYRNRKKFKKRSGGLLLLVKDCYVKHIKYMKMKSINQRWIEPS